MTDDGAPSPDLASCDAEPIHIPGSIQPPGCLLVLQPHDWRITHGSANIEQLLSSGLDQLIGKTLSKALGRTVAHRLTNALTTSLGPSLPGRAFDVEVGGALCNATIHEHAGRILLEFEPAMTSRDDALPLLLVRAMLTRMQQSETTIEVCETAVDQLQMLIGFDRVMVYQFLQDGSGCVIAEKTRTGSTSYVGHHYPASDIPAQARALYVKNWIRTIADVNAAPVPVLPELKPSEQPIDLSFCGQRSVSPIHIEYLKNMGVAASMSISIVVAGKLWGLIACHHALPRAVAAETRVAAELFGQAFSLHLSAIQRLDATEMLRAARARLDKLASELPSTGSLSTSLGPRLAELASILPCDGAGIWINGIWQAIGAVPPAEAIPDLTAALSKQSHGEIFATHQLSVVVPSAVTYADVVSGVLAVPLSRAPGDYLLFFRREFIKSIAWAGNPEKPVLAGDVAERLSPRKSFELWKQEVYHTSKVWEAPDRLAAEALRITLLEVVLKFTEVLAKEKAKSAEQQRMFIAELNHRVKNALALVGALVKQSQGSYPDVEMFVADLEGRILSLAKAHDQATSPDALDLRMLIETELEPFRAPETRRIIVDGPPVALESRAFAVLALVFHEMTTNAAKHGALSVQGGGIEVRWEVDEDGTCSLLWSENGGPPVTAPARKSFGSKLIERQIPFELGGDVNVSYDYDGVRIYLSIPARSFVTRTHTAKNERPVYQTPATTVDPLANISLLVVEDSLLVALETETVLRKAGASHVVVCSTAEEALAYLINAQPNFAILDINLFEGTSLPIADALLARNIPFVFATGYGTSNVLPDKFAHITILTKPYKRGVLVDAIRNAAPN